jgi:hypothetical protein
LHATTAGHLSDGYYENGLLAKKGSTVRHFCGSTSGSGDEPGDIKELYPIPPFRESGRARFDSRRTTPTSRARSACSVTCGRKGRAVDGRVGFDGDYRGEGCAACHVTYALDGLSESADAERAAQRAGSPRMHSMTRAPSTDTCTSAATTVTRRSD